MRFLVLVTLVAAGLLAAFAPGAGGRAANTATFADPAGDGGAGPDVTSLTVSDAPDGVVRFTFTLTGMANDSGVFAFLDTDRSAATGDEGYDEEIEMTVDSGGKRWFDVTRWDGSDWTEVPLSGSMGMTVSGDTWTLRVGRADLGGTAGFTFWAVAALFDADGNVVAGDLLPDGGSLLYELSPATTTKTTTTTKAAVVPWIGRATLTPAPRAGKRVTVTFPVTDRTTGAPLTSGTMMCDPKIGGKVLRHSESFGDGRAQLRFTIPKTAQGKTLKVSLTIRAGSRSAHTVATFRVR